VRCRSARGPTQSICRDIIVNFSDVTPVCSPSRNESPMLIYAGANEMQRNIMAKAVLGL